MVGNVSESQSARNDFASIGPTARLGLYLS